MTLKGLCAIICGGRLVEVYIKNGRGFASFLEGASDFIAYAKKKDLYLAQKRVEVAWSERQFTIGNTLANRIRHGATRNIRIRGAQARVTEAEIRDNLEHIHNLVVVDLSFKHGDAYLSVNSINNALFARQCLLSRATYKGLRFEWLEDECARPLPKVETRSYVLPSVREDKGPAMSNMFSVLGLEDDHDDSSEEEVEELELDLGYDDSE